MQDIAKEPKYHEFDQKARQSVKERFKKHLHVYTTAILNCINQTISAMDSLYLPFDSTKYHFLDDTDIEATALQQFNTFIHGWRGVQVSRLHRRHDTLEYRMFERITKNYVDQNSWRIYGDYLFAPYITLTTKYLKDYCVSIMYIDVQLRNAIYDYGCIYFFGQLLQQKIKFPKCKCFPLLRGKTLMKSRTIHHELELLHSKLKIQKFLEERRMQRKLDSCNSLRCKGLNSRDFYRSMEQFCQFLLIKNQNKMFAIYGERIVAAFINDTERLHHIAAIIPYDIKCLCFAFYDKNQMQIDLSKYEFPKQWLDASNTNTNTN